MSISTDLLKLVPVGEENAVPGLLLWRQLGMWSAETIKKKLNALADAGLIERKMVVRDARPTSLYFRRS